MHYCLIINWIRCNWILVEWIHRYCWILIIWSNIVCHLETVWLGTFPFQCVILHCFLLKAKKQFKKISISIIQNLTLFKRILRMQTLKQRISKYYPLNREKSTVAFIFQSGIEKYRFPIDKSKKRIVRFNQWNFKQTGFEICCFPFKFPSVNYKKGCLVD